MTESEKTLAWFETRVKYFAVKNPQEIEHFETIRKALQGVDEFCKLKTLCDSAEKLILADVAVINELQGEVNDIKDKSQILLKALETIAKRPDLPNPERDAEWKNCMKWSAHEAQEAINNFNSDETGVGL